MVLAVVDDLLFGSKLRAAAQAAGQPIVFVRQREDILGPMRAHSPDLVIVDLDRDMLDPIGAILAIRSAPEWARVSLAGFASHVHGERMQQARDAGCNQVFARSAFVAALPDLMRVPSPRSPQP
jgi:CheY-like chemotaxis protein